MGTREKILAAAARIMREQGYARATTKEIARAAGFSGSSPRSNSAVCRASFSGG